MAKPTIGKNPYSDPQEAFRNELRAKYPGRAKRALGNGKAASIELFCLECIGGSAQEAKQCESRSCFLWPHGFGRSRAQLNPRPEKAEGPLGQGAPQANQVELANTKETIP